jgi:hypothetical protein
MKDLQIKAQTLAEHLNKNGFHIESVITYDKGQTILFKTVPEDTVFLTQYFGIGWNAGVQLKFHVINGKLLYKGKGAFGFHTDAYDTPANNNTLNDLVKNTENYSF